ncbi:hypothetical protein KTR10_02140 [Candidatus Kaiserbacteria bacterium]|nr:hypothetical protein [Candidatus Kaiserbacteria bacterium]
MPRDHDVIVYMRHVRLDVVIPKKNVWDFMREFGEAFAVNDDIHGKLVKAVDGYHDHPNGCGWHVQVTVHERDEKKFYAFLNTFCSQRKLSFRQP